jgi:hypothetical protein
LCAIGVFLLSILDALNDITLEMHVVLTCNRLKKPAYDVDLIDVREKTGNEYWQREDLVRVRQLDHSAGAKGLCFLLVGIEGGIWAFLLICGTKYILTQDTVSNLVQSIVAINFVNNIDNLTYRAFVPSAVCKNIEDIEFEIPLVPSTGKKTKAQNCLYLFTLVGSTPLLAAISIGIVYGLRMVYCVHH